MSISIPTQTCLGVEAKSFVNPGQATPHVEAQGTTAIPSDQGVQKDFAYSRSRP